MRKQRHRASKKEFPDSYGDWVSARRTLFSWFYNVPKTIFVVVSFHPKSWIALDVLFQGTLMVKLQGKGSVFHPCICLSLHPSCWCTLSAWGIHGLNRPCLRTGPRALPHTVFPRTRCSTRRRRWQSCLAQSGNDFIAIGCTLSLQLHMMSKLEKD